MPILAHLLGQSERAATQGLAYLLRDPDLASAFVRLLAPAGLEFFILGRIQAEEQLSETRPDLTVHDSDGRIRILVENKFWAGLTESQPVAYLNRLTETGPTALVFVVPEQRIPGLWTELEHRCHEGQIRLEDERRRECLHWARAGRRLLAITSWKHVLDTLDVAAAEGSVLQQDIAQLQWLTEEADNADAFLPLRPEEVTGQDLAQRMVNYSGLIEPIITDLVAAGIATWGRASNSTHWSGWYLCVHGRFKLWLGVQRENWKQWGITPVWSEHDSTDPESGIENRLREAAELFQEAQVRGNHLRIPIRLTAGVERDRVIDDAVKQLRRVGRRLRKAFLDESPGTDREPESPA